MKTKTSSKMGDALRAVRRRYGWSLTEVAEKTGISRSTLYKVENAGVSLTYDKILQLSDGLDIDIAELFGKAPDGAPARLPTRRSYGRGLAGFEVESSNLSYIYLCSDLLKKKITPMITKIKARSMKEYDDFVRHPGEEFDYVIQGEVDLHTEHYDVVRLKAGDYVYLDSMMGHAFVSAGAEEAIVLSVCSAKPPTHPDGEDG